MLRAKVAFNADNSLAYMPDLLQKEFGIARRGNVGSCFIAQIAFTIAAASNGQLKSSTVARHIFKNIGVRGTVRGFMLCEVLAALEKPISYHGKTITVDFELFRFKNLKAAIESIIDGFPVMFVVDRHVGDVLENEAKSYQDGAIMATVIRPGYSGYWHSYLGIGLDAKDKFVILRDTRHEYCHNGYLKIKSQILKDGWAHIAALCLVVKEIRYGQA